VNVISFSIWGTNEAYVDGALANVPLARQIYPGWSLRIYCRLDVPHAAVDRLTAAGFDVRMMEETKGPWEGLYWRFFPIIDPAVEHTLVRDCDSRLNPREAAAVSAWLESGKLLHTMRDHYQHIVPIMGGMWGCRHWPKLESLYSAWDKHSEKGCDQDFLREKVWPEVVNNAMAHDRYPIITRVKVPGGTFTYNPQEFYGMHWISQFPPHEPLQPGVHGEHVGARVGL
jgi:hypothetical protein